MSDWVMIPSKVSTRALGTETWKAHPTCPHRTPSRLPSTAAVPSPLRARRRVRAAAAMAVQVVLIALGVFLGLAGEEWRQDARTAARRPRRCGDSGPKS